MSEGEPPTPLKDFETRLREAKDRQDATSPNRRPVLRSERGASSGYRVAVDLFAGMLFGVGVGWFLDRQLGTKPWLMVVLFILGAAAGLLNAYRALQAAQKDDDTPSARK